MAGENKCTHKLIVSINYTDEKKSHCNMRSCCGSAVEPERSLFCFTRGRRGAQERRLRRNLDTEKNKKGEKKVWLLLNWVMSVNSMITVRFCKPQICWNYSLHFNFLFYVGTMLIVWFHLGTITDQLGLGWDDFETRLEILQCLVQNMCFSCPKDGGKLSQNVGWSGLKQRSPAWLLPQLGVTPAPNPPLPDAYVSSCIWTPHPGSVLSQKCSAEMGSGEFEGLVYTLSSFSHSMDNSWTILGELQGALSCWGDPLLLGCDVVTWFICVKWHSHERQDPREEYCIVTRWCYSLHLSVVSKVWLIGSRYACTHHTVPCWGKCEWKTQWSSSSVMDVFLYATMSAEYWSTHRGRRLCKVEVSVQKHSDVILAGLQGDGQSSAAVL